MNARNKRRQLRAKRRRLERNIVHGVLLVAVIIAFIIEGWTAKDFSFLALSLIVEVLP